MNYKENSLLKEELRKARKDTEKVDIVRYINPILTDIFMVHK